MANGFAVAVGDLDRAAWRRRSLEKNSMDYGLLRVVFADDQVVVVREIGERGLGHVGAGVEAAFQVPSVKSRLMSVSEWPVEIENRPLAVAGEFGARASKGRILVVEGAYELSVGENLHGRPSGSPSYCLAEIEMLAFEVELHGGALPRDGEARSSVLLRVLVDFRLYEGARGVFETHGVRHDRFGKRAFYIVVDRPCDGACVEKAATPDGRVSGYHDVQLLHSRILSLSLRQGGKG